MPNRSVFDDWSDEDIQAFDVELANRRFKDFSGIVEWARERGLDVSRSAAHRRAQKVRRRMEKVKATAEACQALYEIAPDKQALISSGSIAMVQSEIFEIMMKLEDAEEAEPAERMALLKDAAKSLLDTTNASIKQKAWQEKYEAQIRAEERAKAADQAATIARKGGLSADAVEQLRREILGIAA
jgi:hypothetical protein